MKATYNIDLSYDQNYAAGPTFEGTLPDLTEMNAGLPPAHFLGQRVNSTLGVPAGPLLNAAYIKLYADLGFDVLTYKTVRTHEHASHAFPNVRAVETSPGWYRQVGDKPSLYTFPQLDESQPLFDLSITNSFGMPSRAPEVWREDVAKAKAGLNPGQVLVVSVVGTARPGGSLEDLAADFGLAAGWAAEAGADAIEANLSCPNVRSSEGSLYQSPVAVKTVAQALSRALAGRAPFLLKIGYLEDLSLVEQVVQAAREGGAAGLAAINTIPAKVYDREGQQALPGEGRLVSGICGSGIKEAGQAMTRRLLETRAKLGLTAEQFAVVSVGGVMTGEDALEYLHMGADGVQSGTGAMWHPYLASDFKKLLKASALEKVSPR
ncbi:MAG TPA: dihydroorotate dehydrogenase [Chloroflexia bacterium]|nr:dihydroorotate dehydrogenase [Chloroflexia bacterium]